MAADNKAIHKRSQDRPKTSLIWPNSMMDGQNLICLRGIINNIIKIQRADLHFKGIELIVDIPQLIPD